MNKISLLILFLFLSILTFRKELDSLFYTKSTRFKLNSFTDIAFGLNLNHFLQ